MVGSPKMFSPRISGWVSAQGQRRSPRRAARRLVRRSRLLRRSGCEGWIGEACKIEQKCPAFRKVRVARTNFAPILREKYVKGMTK